MVATPIGNLDDITLRALKVLEAVDVVACEDTRHTAQLLTHFNLHKRTIACHAHNEEESASGIIALLERGQSVAYCSDAGTPGISDPGARLVERVREAGFPIVPVPGASALTTLVSAAGNIGRSILFEGFLSPKKGRRQRRLMELCLRGDAFIIYESPFRVMKTLEDVASADPGCRLVVGRELTKKHEEFITGSVSDILADLGSRAAIKGEFAIVVVPSGAVDADAEEDKDA